MNKEQLLETLKGLTTALEASTNTIDKEALSQAFYAGVRYVLRDLGREGAEVTAEIGFELNGVDHYFHASSPLSLGQKYLDGYTGDYEVKSEKYCDDITDSEIQGVLSKIGLIPAPKHFEIHNDNTDTDNA